MEEQLIIAMKSLIVILVLAVAEQSVLADGFLDKLAKTEGAPSGRMIKGARTLSKWLEKNVASMDLKTNLVMASRNFNDPAVEMKPKEKEAWARFLDMSKVIEDKCGYDNAHELRRIMYDLNLYQNTIKDPEYRISKLMYGFAQDTAVECESVYGKEYEELSKKFDKEIFNKVRLLSDLVEERTEIHLGHKIVLDAFKRMDFKDAVEGALAQSIIAKSGLGENDDRALREEAVSKTYRDCSKYNVHFGEFMIKFQMKADVLQKPDYGSPSMRDSWRYWLVCSTLTRRDLNKMFKALE